jgi:hypothetical protein
VLRIFLFTMALLCAGVPALAQPVCTEPQAPPPVNGAHLNEDQLRAAVAAAKGYLAQSDLYQSCLKSEMDAAQTQAGTEGKMLDTAVEAAMRTRVASNQKRKEKVGLEINNAIFIFKKTHLK